MQTNPTKNLIRSLAVMVALGAAAAGTQACVPAAAAGAGAASAVYLTSRGAKAQVKGSTEEVEADSRKVLADQSIQVTDEKVEKSGKHRELQGKKGDVDVTITIDRHDDETSEVEVTARKSAVTWDKDYAKSLLGEIVQRT
jgi:PDZ domain-containing secreted protein